MMIKQKMKKTYINNKKVKMKKKCVLLKYKYNKAAENT